MSNSKPDDDVTVGEVTIQFSADDSAGKKELRELKELISQQVNEMEDAKAVIESYTLDGFDRKLSWSSDSDE